MPCPDYNTKKKQVGEPKSRNKNTSKSVDLGVELVKTNIRFNKNI